MIIVLMGVTGSGKTTVGRQLAAELDWSYYDADDFHPPANVEKMKQAYRWMMPIASPGWKLCAT